MIERHFGESVPWSVGVEEELMLVDERTYALVPAAKLVLDGAPEGLKGELLLSVIEVTTDICASPAEAIEQLRDRRSSAAERARRDGLRVLAAGSHPFGRPEDQPITDDPDYVEFVSYAGPAARRQGVCGLHVHVGMPDADTCVRAFDAIVPWLPVVLALSANSPFFRGEETGLLSTRAEVLATLPRAGAPPRVASYAEWEELMERWVAAGLIPRYTSAWWDARVHPKLGTLEVRIADQPTEPDVVARLVEWLHALAVRGASGDLPSAAWADYQSNRFAAARFGPRAELVWQDRLVSVTELANELGAPLDGSRCEADRQLQLRGGFEAVCADLVARTVPG